MRHPILLLGALLAPSLSAQESAEADLPRVLFLTHSAGFVHSVVARPSPDQLAHAERSLIEAAQGRLSVTATQDCALIDAENLARYDALLFYTTGELPIDEENREALMTWIRDGGAFCGIHCATDTFYRYAPYMDMIGGTFDGHPWHQNVTVRVEDTSHPATRHLGQSFVIKDEIYQFRGFSRHPLRVLLSLDPRSVDIARGKREDRDYATSWCKEYGRGRVFYTALGHREEVWQDERFLQHLMAGIEWAIAGPDYSPPAPDGATVLFDGTGLAGWQHQDGEDARWKVIDASMEVTRGTGGLVSRESFGGSFLLHIEFRVPVTPDTNSWQDRGNSGIYVQGRYEVQVLDSFGLELRGGDCGAIYGKHVPVVNACKPAGTWQTYDILFTAPRLDESGEKLAHARATVWQNGLKIHDDVEVDGPTAAAMAGDEPGIGPIMLQDHGHPVRYRNVWVQHR